MQTMPGSVRADGPDLRMRVAAPLPIAPQLGLQLKPAVARWSNYLILASDAKVIQGMIDAKASKKGFIAQPEFAKLSAHMPTEGSAFQIGTKLFSDTMMRLQMEGMKDQPGIKPEQRKFMEQLFSYSAGSSTYGVTTHTETGILTVSQTSQDNPKAARPGALLGAALAFIASSAAEGAGKQAEVTKSLNNAKQIGAACNMYATDHDGKFPSQLKELVPHYITDEATLRSPFAPEDAEGYTIVPGLTYKAPPDTILAEDAHSVQGAGKRIVIQVDGTARSMKAGE
jgi:hypothetical protein